VNPRLTITATRIIITIMTTATDTVIPTNIERPARRKWYHGGSSSMTQAYALTAIATLSVLLAMVSVMAGVLWWRGRSWPMIDVFRLAAELADRQKALEVLIEKLERKAALPAPKTASSSGLGLGGRRGRRVDRGEPTAIGGPTLISVPDLAAAPSPAAAAELGRRFGAVWELADAGLAPDEIARRTGQPIGEVELVLGLRRQLTAAGSRA
jgi:hypothetical protein